MENENQSHKSGELSLEELISRQREAARVTAWLAFSVVLSSAGLAWGIRDWLSPTVSTSDSWTLPIALIFFVQMAGLFAFCLQELIKLNRQIKRRQDAQP